MENPYMRNENYTTGMSLSSNLRVHFSIVFAASLQKKKISYLHNEYLVLNIYHGMCSFKFLTLHFLLELLNVDIVYQVVQQSNVLFSVLNFHILISETLNYFISFE